MKDPFSNDAPRSFDWAENFHSVYYRIKNYLHRFWWVLLITISVSVAWQAYKELNREPMYSSSARLMVSGRISIPESDVYQETIANSFSTQLELMQSNLVRQRAAERLAALRPDLERSPVKFNAFMRGKAAIFELRTKGPNPEYTQAYLDACIEAYRSIRRERKSNVSENTMLSITEKLAALEREMQEMEDRIVDFQKRNNIVFLEEQGMATGTYLAQLQKQLSEFKMSRKLLENLSLEENLRRSDTFGMPADAAVDGGVGADEAVSLQVNELSESYAKTSERLEALLAERDEFAIYLKPKHPKMLQFNREVEFMGNRLAVLRRQGVEAIERQKRTLTTQISNLSSIINDAEETALDFSRRLAEYERLTAGYDRKKNMYDQLLGKIQAIDLNISMDQDTLDVLEPASPARVAPTDIVGKMITGAIMGLVVGSGLIFMLGSLDKRVVSTEDLKQNFDEPILGIIPKEKTFSKEDLGFLREQDSRNIFAEAFRTLRSSILFMERGEKVKKEPGMANTFIITSAVPEEGKSTIASNLAISLAMASSRVLLVDADLRRGHLNRLFKVPNKDGMIEILQNRMTVDEAIQDTIVDNLWFVPRGESTTKTGELLLSGDMQGIVDEMRGMFDFVIFDAAPVLATDDTTSFASKVDSILYVVRSSTIRLRQVKISLDSLKMRGANVLGFIVNFADTKGIDYYYYNKYQYYYSYSTPEGSTT